MADFLEDYSNLAAAGSAFEGFAKGFEHSQDQEMKKLEHQANIDATRARIQREQDQSSIDMMNAGVKRGADGQLTEAPLSPKQRGANQLKAIGEGVKATGFDDNGNPTGYTYDPNTPKAKQIDASKFRISSGNDYKNLTMDARYDTIDRREHEKVLGRLNNNPNLRQRLTQYQNLGNALSTITQADHVTPQQVMEFQQAVRSNLGIKGGSGVGEREETYFKTMGLNSAAWMQFMTGDPATLSKDSNLMKHFKQLAEVEQRNISGQFEKSIRAATSGHDSMYKRRPDLMDDLKEAMSAQQAQMSPNAEPPPQAQPQGLVQPPAQPGLLDRGMGLLKGLFSSVPAQAGAKAKDALDVDLTKLSPAELKAWTAKHGQ